MRDEEMMAAQGWAQGWLELEGLPPFGFTYGGRPWADLQTGRQAARSQRALDDTRTEHTLTYTDTAGGLEVRCVAIQYHDFPTVEWTLHFRNTGAAETPILDDIQALDTRLERGREGEFVLHHHTGSPYTPTDYQPFRTVLDPGAQKRITTSGGRPTNSDLPYFNIEWPGGGVIVVIGWPGQWAAEFERDDGVGLRVRAGQELTHFTLRPGEEVRSPLIVIQFYRGDAVRAQNIWRRWMLAHNTPRPGGKLPSPHMAACSSHQYGEMINADEANQIMFVDRYLEERLPLDYWWMDAGWYPNQTGWPNTGTWEVDTSRFPRGLRAITDHAHARGVKSIVWFEPERVSPGTWLYEKHPEWLLSRPGEWKLLDLGNPEASGWLVEHVDRLIVEQGIDLYRTDFNVDPLDFWRANDPPDRQGITEIRYVTGFLAYLDELRRRHPDMLIDTCASGGRRNDIETLRRAVPLLRSDYILDAVAQQVHTYGIASWLPYHGTGVNATDPYSFRSQTSCPFITACYDMRDRDLDYERARRLIEQWRRIRDCYLGDYYPLTPYSTADDVWMAWQFDRPELGEGIVQAFRRPNAAETMMTVRLRGLEPERRYEIGPMDGGERRTARGAELAEGLNIEAAEAPGSALLVYSSCFAEQQRE